jgi:lipid A disaccharide synthetase
LVTPPNLGQALLAWLDDPAGRDRLTEKFETIHRALRRGADQSAAQAVLDLCAGGDGEAV